MDSKLVYRSLHDGEEGAACALIWRAFERHVAPDYSALGVETFREYANTEALMARRSNHRCWVAVHGTDLVGIIEIREYRHLSQLFVDPDWHRRGIAGTLLQHALNACGEQNPGLERLTVFSSPYAVPVYQRLGFVIDGAEAADKGLRFQPMALVIEP